MDLKILWPSKKPQAASSFNAKHPMFEYEVPPLSKAAVEKLARAQNIVVLGIGGSILPLKALTDAAGLFDAVHFVDTVDPVRWKKIMELPHPLFCVVSKSGETLEVKALVERLSQADRLKDSLIVTDPQKGSLRKLADEKHLTSLEIPSNIGGRFTNFTPFHRGVLERFGVDFDSLLKTAKQKIQALKKDPSELQFLYENIFETKIHSLILWAYGDSLSGLAYWIQQALAESLGKKTKAGKRVGVLPVVLKGPQDQHSVLQLLVDGPQDKGLWFFMPKKSAAGQAGADLLRVLAESTFRTFEERLSHSETSQPLASFEFGDRLSEVVEAIVMMQALVEYSADQLQIDAFDQPGVERGKQIAREMLKK